MMKVTNREYLGDAVYAHVKEYEGGYRELVLGTEDGQKMLIVFEPAVLAKLRRYLDLHFPKDAK